MTKTVVCIMPVKYWAQYYREGRPDAVSLALESFIAETKRDIELIHAGFKRELDFRFRAFFDDAAVTAEIFLRQQEKWNLLCFSAPEAFHPTDFYLKAQELLPEYF